MRHPGGALGYRFSGSETTASFVYISDNELERRTSAMAAGPDWKDRLVDFVRGATVLVHDATYTADEYEKHRGWGHSTYEDAVELALDSGVGSSCSFTTGPSATTTSSTRASRACRARRWLAAASALRRDRVAPKE